MDLLPTLKELCSAVGIAGAEGGAAQTALEYLKNYAPDAYIDDFNNVIGVVRKPEKDEPVLLLDAHIDQIGMIVTFIDENGFLKVAGCGGVDRRLLLGQEVTVYAEQNVKGIVATIPPHLTGGDEKQVPEVDEILIDIGMNREQAQSVISLGDRVSICSGFHQLLGTKVASKSLDDRSGVATILKALDFVQGKELHCGLTVLFSAQEETGDRGAAIAGYNINPDIAVAVDVSFAKTPDSSAHKCGKMGEGVMIGVAPSLSKTVTDTLTRLAEEQNIPHQFEIMGGNSGTNADVLGVQRGGVLTGLLSIPQKYMHTPVEVVDLKDLESVSDLLAAYILSIGGKKA